MLYKLLSATVFSAASTVLFGELQRSYDGRWTQIDDEQTLINRIIDPGLDEEGNAYLNWVGIAGGLYFLDLDWITKLGLLSPQINVPLLLDVHLPFHTTYLIIAMSGAITQQMWISLLALAKVFVYDLRHETLMNNLETRGLIMEQVLYKTGAVTLFPTLYYIFKFFFSFKFNEYDSGLYAKGLVAFLTGGMGLYILN